MPSEKRNINVPIKPLMFVATAILSSIMVACSPNPENNGSTTLADSVSKATPAESTKSIKSADNSSLNSNNLPSLQASPNVMIAPRDPESFENNAVKFDANTIVGLNARESFKQPRVFLTNPVDLKLVQSKLGDKSVLGFRLEEGNVVFYPISNISGYSQVDQSLDKIPLPDEGRVLIPLNKFSPGGQNIFKEKNKIDAGTQQYLRLLKN